MIRADVGRALTGRRVIRAVAAPGAVAICMALPLQPVQSAASAVEPVLGTWVSPPDRKGQTGYVVVRDCGAAYCGRLERAFGPDGAEIVTKAVGQMVLRDMAPVAAGDYQGHVYLPLLDKLVEARVQVTGDQLSVRGCAGPICNSQVWRRVN